MKEAILYNKKGEDKVHCHLCAHLCMIKPGERGKCGVRENQDGTLMSLVYGKLIAQNVDPIEKKPLYHYYPGTLSYSISTMGCNFTCRFCQNADISQVSRAGGSIMGREVAPEEVVREAMRSDCKTIAYTYVEPTIFMEYALDVARLADREDIKNVFVSNGYMTREALDAIGPHLGAANVDLKSFTDTFYKDACGAHLKPVLKTLERMKEMGIWLEVTTLVIPGLNDSEQELKQIAEFIAGLGKETPWHVSAFHPTYQMTDRPRTPPDTLIKARNIGVESGLKYVYTGNILGLEGGNTLCPECMEPVISRYGFSSKGDGMKDAACRSCNAPIHGVGM